jgi:hypothetical protein
MAKRGISLVTEETDRIFRRALPPNVLYQQYQHKLSACTARKGPGIVEYHLCWNSASRVHNYLVINRTIRGT